MWFPSNGSSVAPLRQEQRASSPTGAVWLLSNGSSVAPHQWEQRGSSPAGAAWLLTNGSSVAPLQREQQGSSSTGAARLLTNGSSVAPLQREQRDSSSTGASWLLSPVCLFIKNLNIPAFGSPTISLFSHRYKFRYHRLATTLLSITHTTTIPQLKFIGILSWSRFLALAKVPSSTDFNPSSTDLGPSF